MTTSEKDQVFRRYHAYNNPTRFTDPSGTVTLAGQIAAAIVVLGLFAVTVFMIIQGFKPDMERQAEIRQNQINSCPLEDILHEETFQDNVISVFQSGRPLLAVEAAGISQASTPEDQALFLGEKLGETIGEALDREKE